MIRVSILLLITHLSFGFLGRTRLIRPNFVEISSLWASNHKSDEFDMKKLRQRINEVNNMRNEELIPRNVQERPEEIHVVMLHPGAHKEGIHSIERFGSNIVLAFESKDACENLALQLKTQNFECPTVKSCDLNYLQGLCNKMGVLLQIIREGQEICPPTRNIQRLGQFTPKSKDPNLHLDFLLDMFDLEVDELGALSSEGGGWE